jgi:hypothetical protein
MRQLSVLRGSFRFAADVIAARTAPRLLEDSGILDEEREHRVHGRGVHGKPLGQRFGERAPVLKLAVCDAAAHLAHHIEHAGMLLRMTTARRKLTFFHPRLFLREVRFGVRDERIEAGEYPHTLRIAHRVEQGDEFLVSVVHLGVPQRELIGPGEHSHGGVPLQKRDSVSHFRGAEPQRR